MDEAAAKFIVYRHFTRSRTEYHWRLSSAAGGTLERITVGYLEKADCEATIELAKKPCPQAIIRGLTSARK